MAVGSGCGGSWQELAGVLTTLDMYNEFCGTGEKVPRHIAGLMKNFTLARREYINIPTESFYSKIHKKVGKWINMKPDVRDKLEKKFSISKDQQENLNEKRRIEEKQIDEIKETLEITDEPRENASEND